MFETSPSHSSPSFEIQGILKNFHKILKFQLLYLERDSSQSHLSNILPPANSTKFLSNIKKLERKRTVKEKIDEFKSDFQDNICTNRDLNCVEDKSKIYKIISIFFLVKKFIFQIRNIAGSKNLKLFNKKRIDFINDKSFYKNGFVNTFTENKRMGFLVILLFYYIRKFFNKFKIYIFNPFSNFFIIWNIVLLLFYISNILLIPLKFSFEHEIKFNQAEIMLPILIIEILIKIHTAFYQEGKLIYNRIEILKHYAQKNLLSDLLCFFSLLFPHFSFMFFIKLIDIGKIYRRISENDAFTENFQKFFKFFEIILKIFLLTHVFACVFHYIGQLEVENNSPSWLESKNLENEDWIVRYLNSYYYICVTMNTVGYGDIVPVTEIEKFFTIIFIYFTCIMFAYTLSSISIMINENYESEKKYYEDIKILNRFMRKKKINHETKILARNYLEYINLGKTSKFLQEETTIIEKLSKNLRENILYEANHYLKKYLTPFSSNFSDLTMRKILLKLEEKIFLPGQILPLINNNDKFIYFIQEGSVNIVPRNKETKQVREPFFNLKKNNLIGHEIFFTNNEPNYSAFSKGFTRVCCLSFQNFMKIIKKNNLDFEKYHEIKDKITFNKDYTDLDVKCLICEFKTHHIFNCPCSHLEISRNILISKINYLPFQQRKDFNKRSINHRKTEFRLWASCIKSETFSLDESDAEDFNLITLKSLKSDLKLNSYTKNSSLEEKENQKNNRLNPTNRKNETTSKDNIEEENVNEHGNIKVQTPLSQTHQQNIDGKSEKKEEPLICCGIKKFERYFCHQNFENVIKGIKYVRIRHLFDRRRKKLKINTQFD